MRSINYDAVEFQILRDFARALGVPVELKDKAGWSEKYKDMDGLLYGDGKGDFWKIAILNKGNTKAEVMILVHELAHLFLHPDHNTVGDAEADQQADAAGKMLLEFMRYMLLKNGVNDMKIDFTENETMRMIGYSNAIDADSPEGRAVKDILDGLSMPLTNDNVMMVSYGLTMGRILERRENRHRA